MNNAFPHLQVIEGIHPDQIPAKKDFGANKGCLDEICAWEHFGGLTLEQAFERFCARPDIYQEDFMFMGWQAFIYYLPVIETYLYEVQQSDEFDESEAWILALAIASQTEKKQIGSIGDLCFRLLKLCIYVKSHLKQYAHDLKRQQEINDEWTKLENALIKKAGKCVSVKHR